jgi:hypothetical protein
MRSVPRDFVRRVVVAGWPVLVAGGSLLGATLAEVAYRARLYLSEPDTFRTAAADSSLPSFGVLDKSLWEFDRRFGYVYPPGRSVGLTLLDRGKVVGCRRLPPVNREGNIGDIKGDYAAADLKVVVFGDSFTATQDSGVTWPNVLQDRLSDRLHRKVRVVNFGRDGYSLLQMFDLAAVKVPEWKPDLVIVAFITDDLNRARFWRTAIDVAGEERVLTTIDPTPNPRLDRAADTFILDRKATFDWCNRMRQSGARDSIVEEIEARYRDALLRSAAQPAGLSNRPSLFTLRHAYLYDRIRYGDAFHSIRTRFGPSQNPRITYDDYRVDGRLAEAIRLLAASHIPYVIVHLPYYPELRKGREYVLQPQQSNLLKSLEQVTEHRVIGLRDLMPLPRDRLDTMNMSATNFHPSLFGMRLYGAGVAEALIRRGLVR